jgi:hypothetical protein
MCSNTEAALAQIMDAMDEQGAVQFVKDLSMDELRSFNELTYMAQQFAKRADRALGQCIDDNVEAILGVDN